MRCRVWGRIHGPRAGPSLRVRRGRRGRGVRRSRCGAGRTSRFPRRRPCRHRSCPRSRAGRRRPFPPGIAPGPRFPWARRRPAGGLLLGTVRAVRSTRAGARAPRRPPPAIRRSGHKRPRRNVPVSPAPRARLGGGRARARRGPFRNGAFLVQQVFSTPRAALRFPSRAPGGRSAPHVRRGLEPIQPNDAYIAAVAKYGAGHAKTRQIARSNRAVKALIAAGKEETGAAIPAASACGLVVNKTTSDPAGCRTRRLPDGPHSCGDRRRRASSRLRLRCDAPHSVFHKKR